MKEIKKKFIQWLIDEEALIQEENVVHAEKAFFANSFLKLLFNDPFHQIEKEFGLPEILHTHDIYEIKQLVFIYHAIRKNIKIYISPRGTLSPVALSRNRVKKILYMHLLLNPADLDLRVIYSILCNLH